MCGQMLKTGNYFNEKKNVFCLLKVIKINQILIIFQHRHTKGMLVSAFRKLQPMRVKKNDENMLMLLSRYMCFDFNRAIIHSIAEIFVLVSLFSTHTHTARVF